MDATPKQVTYIAERDDIERTVEARKVVCLPDDTLESLALPPRLDLRRHSPAGFEFGYAGSGPAQLSLAILADALGPERAIDLYQRFKRDFVTKAGGDEFRVTRGEIEAWAAALAPRPADLGDWGEAVSG